MAGLTAAKQQFQAAFACVSLTIIPIVSRNSTDMGRVETIDNIAINHTSKVIGRLFDRL